MCDRRAIRYLLVPVTLLLVAMALGGVWHHHARSSDANCQICYLSHQPIERPLATHHAPALALLGPAPEARDAGLAPTLAARRVPARAPPVA
jgi:hypothetical protein